MGRRRGREPERTSAPAGAIDGLRARFTETKEEFMEEEFTEDDTFDLDGLAVDVFSLTEGEAEIESLTGAHGMTETAASCSCWSGNGSCVSA
jgi:hypothetical protein